MPLKGFSILSVSKVGSNSVRSSGSGFQKVKFVLWGILLATFAFFSYAAAIKAEKESSRIEVAREIGRLSLLP